MNHAVVVDTDVVSYLHKGDTRARRYAPMLEGKLLVVSFMTAAELERWAVERGWAASRTSQMRAYLRANYVVHGVDQRLCRIWAEVTDNRRRQGRPIQCADAWIAATALASGIPAVTNNTKDFMGIPGLTVLP